MENSQNTRDKMKQIFAIVAILLLILVGCTTTKMPTGGVVGPEAEKIVIGSFAPLTGNVAYIGEDSKNSITLGLEEINAQGGINGKQLEVIFEDSRCDAKTATSATNKLVNIDKVPVIIGTICSAATLAGAPIAEQNKVVMVSAGSSNPSITDSGDYIFRTWPSDALQGVVMAEHVFNVEGLKTAAVMYQNSDYNVGLAEVFMKHFKKIGGQILADEKYEPESKDFRTSITKIKAANPEAIYIVPYNEGGLVTRQLKELGVNARIFSAETYGTQNVLDDAAGSAERVIYATPKFDETNPESKTFLEKYTKRFGKSPSLVAAAANAYDNAMLVAQAIEIHGPESDKIRDFLYNVKDYPGAAGKLTIDENGDALKDFQLMIVKDNEFKKYDDVINKDKKTIKIGLSLPLSGDSALIGQGARNGALLALDEVKQKQTKFNYEIVVEDDMMQNARALTVFHKLHGSDNVDAIVSITSGTGNVIAAQAEEKKLLHMAIASDPAVVEAKRYSFKHWVTPEAEAERYVKELKERGISKIALLATNQRGVLAVRDALVIAAGDDVEILYQGIADPTDKDLRTIALKAMSKEPEAILNLLLPGQMIIGTKEIIKTGFKGKIHSIETFEFEEDPEGILEGRWYVYSADATEDFTESFKQRFDDVPGVGAANIYDIIFLLVEAFENADGDMEKAIDEMHKIKDFPGALGSLTVDEHGSVQSPAVVKIVEDGKFKVLKE